MVWIPGRTFWMGSDDFYPEERPVPEVGVEGFWMPVVLPHKARGQRRSQWTRVRANMVQKILSRTAAT
jgi:hypothetical protein